MQGARKILFRMSDEWGYYSRSRELTPEICYEPSRFLNLLLQIRKRTWTPPLPPPPRCCLFIFRTKTYFILRDDCFLGCYLKNVYRQPGVKFTVKNVLYRYVHSGNILLRILRRTFFFAPVLMKMAISTAGF